MADFLSPTNDDELWTLQVDNENSKIWTRIRGYDIVQEIPIAQELHYFRDIDDPNELVSIMENDRFVGD